VKRASAKSRAVAVGGGVSVLILTGMAGVWQFSGPGATAASPIAGVALVVILLIGALLLARFVARHGDEIGEARFETTNKSSSDG